MSSPSPRKAVFDINVFLQALGNAKGPAGACLDAVWNRRVEVIVTQQLIDELTAVVQRPDVARKLRFLPARFHRLLEELKTHAVYVENVPERFILTRDPDDSQYINLAIASGAMLVVSRDNDLLDLMVDASPEGKVLRSQYPTFQVLTPPQFLKILEPS